jgi:hypothetical protein
VTPPIRRFSNPIIRLVLLIFFMHISC